MPKGPKGEKRPADVIGGAVKVMRIATGEDEDTVEDDGKDPCRKALGKKGGAARAKKLTAKKRSEIAKNAGAKAMGKERAEGLIFHQRQMWLPSDHRHVLLNKFHRGI